MRGAIAIGDRRAEAFNLVELTDGEGLDLASPDGAVLLLGHADPIGEPVVSHGPFVMTTREEIIQAIQDYQAGKFGEVRA